MIEYTKTYDISMVRGDTLPFSVEITDFTGTVTGVAMSCRTAPNAPSVVFKKDLNDGVTASGDVYSVRVAPADTASLEPGVYYYDIEVTIGSDVYTPIKGKLYLDWDVSR